MGEDIYADGYGDVGEYGRSIKPRGGTKMSEAVNFLTQVYYGSVPDVAAIKVAEAENDRETIEKYLMFVHNYTARLINKLKEE